MVGKLPKASFETRDPSDPAFWTERFEKGFLPWDKGGVPHALQEFMARSSGRRTALVPGCGTGYEVAYLSQAGWEVVGIDFSSAAVAAAGQTLGQWRSRVRQADFFSFEPPRPVDFIYERAFLCALPPARWPDIARRWASLLQSGGLLAGFFYFGDDSKGPPFAIRPSRLEELLDPHFVRTESSTVTDSLPVFEGGERWQVWRRR